jgi:vitamin B12 transporter
MHSNNFIVTALAASLVATSSYAEENTELETVVVTARRAVSDIKNTPQSMEIISETDIEQTRARELTDVLKKNSSVNVIQYPGKLSGIGIRGFRPEYSGINQHTLLLIDGRPAMTDNLSLVDMDRVERIEILKGPASALYGSSAMGGVVNVISRDSRGPIHGMAQLAYGSYDTKEVKATAGGSLVDALDFDYSGSYYNQSEDYRMGGGLVRPNTRYSEMNQAVRLGWNINPEWRLSLNSNLYRGWDIATPGNIATGTTQQANKDMDLYGTDLKLEGSLADHRLTMRYYTGQQSYDLYNKTSADAAVQKYLPYHSYWSTLNYSGWQLKDVWAWGKNTSLVIGIDQYTPKQDTKNYNPNGSRTAPYFANNQQQNLGVYAENTWYFNDQNSTFYLGVRHDEIRVSTYKTPYKTDFIPSSAVFSNISPSTGFKHLLGMGFRLHGTVGKGFVVPDAAYVTGSASATSGKVTTFTQGNPGLKPESSWTYDLGLEWSNPSIYTDLTVFATNVTDRIVNTITTIETTKSGYITNLSTYKNGSGANIRGMEWNGRWQVIPSLQLSLTGTYFFERKENRDNEWLAIRNVPLYTAVASAELVVGAWTGRLGIRYVGPWLDNNWQGDTTQYIRYGDFATVDVYLGYRFDNHNLLALNMENLIDRYYTEKGGYPMPGINGRLAYRYDF